MANVFLKSVHIAGFSYYDGAFIFDELSIGSKIDFALDKGNIHDDHSVELRYKNHKIGYIPRHENNEIATIMQAGHDIFTGVVQQISPDEHPEEQIRVGVFIVDRKPKKKKS